MERKICFDRATLDDKVILDDDKFLVMPAVIASEIVHQYEDGWAYKPASELEKMAKTAGDIGAVPITILKHPDDETHGLVLRQDAVHGRAENIRYVKNLIDPKTQRPCRKGVRADMRWFKDRVPEPIIQQIKNAVLRDVSIGFTFNQDLTVGDWQGTHYDYVQRGIFLQHVAAPLEKGRCPGPMCGIGFDSIFKSPVKVEADKVVKRGDKWCVIHCHGEEEGEVIKCFDSKEEAEAMHRAIQANKADSTDQEGEKPPKDWMDKCKAEVSESNPDYSEEQANAVCGNIWHNLPEQHGIGDVLSCYVCREMLNVGLAKSGRRLAVAYGEDVMRVIRGDKPAHPVTTETLLLEAKKTIDSAKWIFQQ